MNQEKLRIPIKRYVFKRMDIEGAYLSRDSTEAKLEDAIVFLKRPYNFMDARQILYNYHSECSIGYWNFEVEEIEAFLVEASHGTKQKKNRK